MKAIMISIKPQWIEKILNNEKTIEIRKTKPRCELPCKVYIYCTNNKKHLVAPFRFLEGWKYKEYNENTNYACGCTSNMGETINGKVVAEFTLNKVEPFSVGSWRCDDIEKLACLTYKEMIDYFYKPEELDGSHIKWGYAWHIDNLKIYEKPKELSEFGVKRVFQSWGYVNGKNN